MYKIRRPTEVTKIQDIKYKDYFFGHRLTFETVDFNHPIMSYDKK